MTTMFSPGIFSSDRTHASHVWVQNGEVGIINLVVVRRVEPLVLGLKSVS
jgi:hypothetical protein